MTPGRRPRPYRHAWFDEVWSTNGPQTMTRAVLTGLYKHMDDEGACFPGILRIAEAAGCSESTAKRHLSLAEREGWIVRGHREGAIGQGWRARSYQARLPEDALTGFDASPAHGAPSAERWSGSRLKVIRETPEGGPAEYQKVVREPDTNRPVEQIKEQTTGQGKVGVADRFRKNSREAFRGDEFDDDDVAELTYLILQKLHLGAETVRDQNMDAEEDHVRRVLGRGYDWYRLKLAIRALAHLRDQGRLGPWIDVGQPCTLAALFKRGAGENFFERCVGEGYKLENAGRPRASDRNGDSGSFVAMSDFATVGAAL